jgi:hypothetical protein
MRSNHPFQPSSFHAAGVGSAEEDVPELIDLGDEGFRRLKARAEVALDLPIQVHLHHIILVHIELDLGPSIYHPLYCSVSMICILYLLVIQAFSVLEVRLFVIFLGAFLFRAETAHTAYWVERNQKPLTRSYTDEERMQGYQ